MRIWMFAIGLLHVANYSTLSTALWWIPIALLFALCRNFWPHAIYPLLFALGASVSALQLYPMVMNQLPESMDRQVVNGQFEVVSLVERGARAQVFAARLMEFECISQKICPQWRGGTVRLSWYQNDVPILPGQIWRGNLKLKRPRGGSNPGGFDYHGWLLANGYVATGSIAGEPVYQSSRTNWAVVRAYIATALEKASASTEFQRFWPALILADRSAVSSQDWRMLQATGTVHLFAISGLHIGLMAAVMHLLGVAVARFVVVCCIPNRSGVTAYLWIPAVFSVVGALFYAGLAGFSIPTVRALVACVFLQVMRLAGWRVSSWKALGLVVCSVGVVDPMAIVSPGFWLSFSAVLILMVYLHWNPIGPSTGIWRRGSQQLIQLVKIQGVLLLGMALPLAFLGQGSSVLAPAANAIAVPIFSLLIIPMLFVGTVFAVLVGDLASLIFSLLDWVFSGVWGCLHWLAQFHQAIWWPSFPLSVTSIFAIIFGLLLLISPAALGMRGLGVGVILIFVLAHDNRGRPLQLTVADVGQGLAVIFQVGDRTLIYDSGPGFSDGSDAGARIVVPLLRRLGVRQADMVISHGDNDHSGGAQSIQELMSIASIRLGEPLSFELKTADVMPCRQGQRWSVEEATVDVLWPPFGHSYSGNRASCVLLIRISLTQEKTIKLLLAGDIDQYVEEKIWPSLPTDIDVLIAPHHGSATSSSVGFVRRASPRYVIYSNGYKTHFGHPHPRVEKRYQREGSIQLSTALSGAVTFRWSEQGGDNGETAYVEIVEQSRQLNPKLWY